MFDEFASDWVLDLFGKLFDAARMAVHLKEEGVTHREVD